MFHHFWSEIPRGAILRRLLVLLLVVLTIRGWVWSPMLISGKSMLPTCRSGQIAGINKLAYLFISPRRGDIVAIWTGSELLLKRVVGLPGEEISARGGNFCVNGKFLRESYILFTDSWSIAPGRIETGCYVVAGDNRSLTLVAVVGRDRIIGRVTPLW
jgi:signal peptidase I